MKANAHVEIVPNVIMPTLSGNDDRSNFWHMAKENIKIKKKFPGGLTLKYRIIRLRKNTYTERTNGAAQTLKAPIAPIK